MEREDKAADESCPVEMGKQGPKCGRPLHNAPQGSDERPVCLMHSKDPNKAEGAFFNAFWREFEMILESAGENEAHFERFAFPKFELKKRRFEAICRFENAIFMQKAIFSNVTFARYADFSNATFTQDALFIMATFMQYAHFRGATFTQYADFDGATFTQYAEFSYATFMQYADFSSKATFTQDALFIMATFMQYADFRRATFMQYADFSNATFMQAAHFEETGFRGTAIWVASRFLESAAFRRTMFNPERAGMPSAVFASASFSDPGKIIFDDVDLSRVLFHNCDVSGVWFTSSARWAKRGSHGDAVFEEFVPLELARGLERDGQRDYRAVAQTYQQLKKNYDTRLDYWTANEFHFGEMEMKRLVTPYGGRLLGLRRWAHRWLSLTAWYRYASDYGNSYRKPLLWLLTVLALFAALFPLQASGCGTARRVSQKHIDRCGGLGVPRNKTSKGRANSRERACWLRWIWLHSNGTRSMPPRIRGGGRWRSRRRCSLPRYLRCFC